MTNNKSYLIASLAKSFDNYHTKNNQIHLLGSIFYTTNEVNFEIFKKSRVPLNYTIFRLLSENNIEGDDLFEVYNHSATVTEIRISIENFLGLYVGENSKVECFENNFIYKILNIKDFTKNELGVDHNYSMKDTIFIFEDIDWFTLQLLFKHVGIILSSGSISKRQILSTTQFNLSKLLFVLGYNNNDLYNSYSYLNKFFSDKNENNLNSLSFEVDNLLMSNFIKTELSKEKNTINNTILKLRQRIEEISNNINSLENDLSTKKDQIFKNNKSLNNSQKIITLSNKIESNKKFITSLEDQISSLNPKLLDIDNKISNITNLAYKDLKNLYINNYHNLKLSNDISKLKNILSDNSNLTSKSKNLINKRGIKQGFNNRRFYNTVSRSYSTYSNNSLVSENLMKILK